MSEFLKTKNKIAHYFSGREGFTDEIMESITATYIYLQRKYPQLISDSLIPDVETFKFGSISNSNNSRSVANIYINRIYNNVQKVETVPSGVVNEFLHNEKKIVLCTQDINARISEWNSVLDSILTPEQKGIFIKKLRAKIITHEFAHAGAYNGKYTGFLDLVTENVAVGNKYFNGKTPPKIGISRLEETMAEDLALNVVGCNLILTEKRFGNPSQFLYHSRNPESSNSPLNCISEYFVRVFPESVVERFVDPCKYLAMFALNHYTDFSNEPCTDLIKFNKSYTKITKENFLFNFYLKLKYLASNTKNYNLDTDTTNEIKNTYNSFQTEMLKIYNKTYKFDSIENTIQAIKDAAAFKLFAFEKEYNIIDQSLQDELTYLKNNCEKYGKIYNLNIKDIANTYLHEIRGTDKNNNIVITEPYASLKEQITPNP